MGLVYKAFDPDIGRTVAIKVMSTTGGDPDLAVRFRREAQAAGRLHHPNIITIHDVGEHQGDAFLVMEYAEGESLDDLIQGKRDLSLTTKLTIVQQLCTALGYAHRNGVVHRDVKPANIIVLPDNSIRIVDFGIARLQQSSLTKSGQAIGTIFYMSPEQINGQAVDGRSDIFSSGVVLYQLLTNRLPFEGPTTANTILRILTESPPPLSRYAADCPRALQEVLERALEKEREKRFQTADEFADALVRVRQNCILSRHPAEGTVEAPATLIAGSLEPAPITGATIVRGSVATVDMDTDDLTEARRKASEQHVKAHQPTKPKSPAKKQRGPLFRWARRIGFGALGLFGVLGLAFVGLIIANNFQNSSDQSSNQTSTDSKDDEWGKFYSLRGQAADSELREPFTAMQLWESALRSIPISASPNFENQVRERMLLLATKTNPPMKPDAAAVSKLNLGVMSLRSGRTDEAITYFKAARDISPFWAMAYKELATAYEQSAAYDHAAANYALYLWGAQNSPDANEIRQKIKDLQSIKSANK